MRSVPRISRAMSKQNHYDQPEENPIFEEEKPKSSFFATRRDFLYTHFIEDPELVKKRQKEIEEEEKQKKIKENQNSDQSISTQESLPFSTPPPIQNSTPPPQKKQERKIQRKPIEKERKPIKKLSKSEISQVVDRLTLSNENIFLQHKEQHKNHDSNKNINNIEPIRKITNIDIENNAVFDRLFYESTQVYMEKKENRKNQNFDESFECKTDGNTKSIALHKIQEIIDSSFPEKSSLTLKELNDIFIKLGILEQCEKIEKIPQISNIINKWKIMNSDLYDTNSIRDSLIQSVNGFKGKFKQFARERMFSALANRKNNENIKKNQQRFYSDRPIRRVRLTQETFDRLMSPRPDFSPSKEEEEGIENVRVELSPRTLKILKDSEYGNSRLEERDKKLAERAMERIEEIRKSMEKERKKMQKIHHASIPRISPEERARIEELKIKRQNELLNDKQPYKPDIMKYSEFLQLKEAMKEEKEKPPGLDSFLDRMKKGYEIHMKKKFDEDNIRSLPQLPSKKRAASEMKKKKKEIEEEKPPIPQEETETIPDENININKKGKKSAKSQSSKSKNSQANSKQQIENVNQGENLPKTSKMPSNKKK